MQRRASVIGEREIRVLIKGSDRMRTFRHEILSRLRSLIRVGTTGLWLIGACQAAVAQNASVGAFDVPAQPLETPLRQVASEQNPHVPFAPEDVKGGTTHGIKGQYTAREAIQ